MKVFMVVSEWATTDFGFDSDCNIELFDTYEKAKEEFDKVVADEKENDVLFEHPACEVEEEDDYFSVCENGNFVSSHFTIRIIEKEVL